MDKLKCEGRNENRKRVVFALKSKTGKSAQILELPNFSSLYLNVAEFLEEL
jgi:hypothetical protein